MDGIIAFVIIVCCSAGTWKLSRHIHPAFLVLVGVLLRVIGTLMSSAFPMVIGTTGQRLGGVLYGVLSMLSILFQILGLVVMVHGAVLWCRKRKALRQQTDGE